MKIGDIVRRVVERQGDHGRCENRIGVIIEVLADPKTNELYDNSVFRVFWGMGYGAFAISGSKLELLNESR